MEILKKVKFNGPFSRVKESGEKNSGEIIVEKAGYIPAEQQIKNIMRSGEELMLYRKGLYMSNFGGKDEKEAFENYDVTSKPDFDVIDAQRMYDAELSKLNEKYGKGTNPVPEVKEEKPIEKAETSETD